MSEPTFTLEEIKLEIRKLCAFYEEYRTFRQKLDALREHIHWTDGTIVRDIETGLIDFLGEMDGLHSFWRWKLDEAKTLHYHPSDEGFAGWKPIPSHRLQSISPELT